MLNRSQVVNIIGTECLTKFNIQLAKTKMQLETYRGSTVNNRIKLFYQAESNLSYYNLRKETCIEVQGLILKINFVKATTSVEKSCLSTYGTFCVGDIFYYNEILENLSPRQQAQAILCEIFNSRQCYYQGNVTKSKEDITTYQSLLMMHFIGMINEKLWYANVGGNGGRHLMYAQMLDKYPNMDIIYFSPNQNAADYIINSIINGCSQSYDLGGIFLEYSTAHVYQYKMLLTNWYPKQKQIEKRLELVTIYTDLTGKRISGTSKLGRQHLELIKMTNKLADA